MTRMKSLKKDANDQNALIYGRYRNMGACVASEYYQVVPYFFSREGATLNLVGQYRGASAFLIASGPSFASCRQSWLNKPGVWSMTMNNAIRSHRGNAAIIVDDPSRFTFSMWTDPSVQKFVPFSHMDKPLWDNRLIKDEEGNQVQLWQPSDVKVGDCPNVVGYRRNEKFMSKRFLYEDTINWGCHKDFGGGRSVMLASLRILFLLGFREVFLLGVDFQMDDEHKYHFEEERTKGAIKGNMSTYKRMKQWFDELQPHFLAEGFNVFNCNPESKLEAFPHISYKDAIRKVTGELGNTGKERVMGLYTKYQDKVKDYNTARRSQAPQGVISQSSPQTVTVNKPTTPIAVSSKNPHVVIDPHKITEGDTSVIKG